MIINGAGVSLFHWNSSEGLLKPVADTQGNGHSYQVIVHRGAFIVKILSVEGEPDPEFATEKVGNAQFEASGKPAFHRKTGRQGVSAVDNFSFRRDGIAGR